MKKNKYIIWNGRALQVDYIVHYTGELAKLLKKKDIKKKVILFDER